MAKFFIMETQLRPTWGLKIHPTPRVKEEYRRRRNSGSLGSAHSSRTSPRSSYGGSCEDYAGPDASSFG